LKPPEGPWAILMAGQLTEREGMGRGLLQDPFFTEASRDLDGLTGGRFIRWITESKQSELARPEIGSLAVLGFDIAVARAARARFGPPAAACGYSLGFYAAAVEAGAVSAGTALSWVEAVNGEMEREFSGGRHGLAFAIGLSARDLLDAFREAGLGSLRIANVNSRKSIVFGGLRDEVQGALSRLKDRILQGGMLPLPHPLHTSHLDPVRDRMCGWWGGRETAPPKRLLISPSDGARIEGADALRALLPETLVLPTDWVAVVESIARLEPGWLLDTSADGSLGRMTRWVDRSLNVISLEEAFERDD